MHIDEIGSYGLNYVSNRARFLVTECGFPIGQFSDLQQKLLLDLIRRLPKHDPTRSPRNAFITRVVKHKVADLIKQRSAPSLAHFRGEISLNTPLKQDGRRVELGDTLRGPETAGGHADLAVDLERALATLPDDLRSLWDQRAQGLTLTEISQEQGVPRPTLYDRWAKVCEHLRQAGLARYFESE